MRTFTTIILFLVTLSSHAATQEDGAFLGDSAIRRVDNCECYKHIDYQNLKPWEIKWDNPEELRKQISHCICSADIDIQKVKNPRRYLVPGTVVK